ncbi:MAG: Fpg/Nei family DNA glycosylase [Thermoleophilia bacterium]|nr:Fpg/Nei family DNA glycosylase [Thermoleophilia bacterium]
MPEGHAVHRIAREHDVVLAGRRLAASSPQGRAAAAAALVDGRTLERVEAHGKHLFYRFGGGAVIHVHLGRYGEFARFEPPPPEPRATVRLRLLDDAVGVDLVGPSACAAVDPDEEAAILARLGPDPLRPDADSELAWVRLRSRRSPVGAVLLDQRVIAGVGNIFRAEALHAAGIDPRRPASELGREEFVLLWEVVAGMLRRGVEDGRIVTVDAAALGFTRAEIPRALAFNVYGRERCACCDSPVEQLVLGGRRTFRCPVCQPRLGC